MGHGPRSREVPAGWPAGSGGEGRELGSQPAGGTPLSELTRREIAIASIKGTRKGPKIEKPRFRSRKNHRQAIRFTANARFHVLANGKLRLPKIGDVPVRWSRPLPSEP